ncbi:hypothetical protein P9112_010066 [Eukaryota sp. TZLM1-RC]
MSDHLSQQTSEEQIHLPQSIVRLEVICLQTICGTQLPNLKELINHEEVPTNFTEHNFPSLVFIQLTRPDEHCLSGFLFSPTVLSDLSLVKFVELIKNEYLVELSCFPWWIQYPADVL